MNVVEFTFHFFGGENKKKVGGGGMLAEPQVKPLQKSWDILLNVIKSRICYLFILFNLYIID